MKKFLLSLFMILVAVVVSFFGYAAYQYYLAIHADDPIDPYISVLSGYATVTRGQLAVDMEI